MTQAHLSLSLVNRAFWILFKSIPLLHNPDHVLMLGHHVLS